MLLMKVFVVDDEDEDVGKIVNKFVWRDLFLFGESELEVYVELELDDERTQAFLPFCLTSSSNDSSSSSSISLML